MIPLYMLVLCPILIGAAGCLLFGRKSTIIVIIFQLTIVAAAFNNFLYVKQHGNHIENLGGWDSGIGITLKLDLVSAVMVLLAVVLFLAMFLFNYKKDYTNNLFMFLFLVLEGLITGIFVSNDLFNIFVMMEVSTVVVSILIMFKKDSRSIYDGMMYLLINVVAMLFFLFGTGILYKMFGVLDLTMIRQRMALIGNAESFILPYAFIITAVSLKTALMPLFSWLPKAHGTPSSPSIVSAILSGLYVKNGLYLFLRMQKVFHPYIDTAEFFMFMGFLTAVIGFILAISQKDIKLILAYHTVSQIGLIMMGLNMGHPQAYWGGVYHIINHALFKSTLFLTAGIIVDEYKTRNVYEINGLFKRMPVVSIATILAILGITGAPFFNGSISKYWIAYGAKGSFAELGLMLINLGTIMSFIKYSAMFFGDAKEGGADVCGYRKAVVLAMGLICLAGGILGGQLMNFLFNQHMKIDIYSYAEKSLAFAGSLLLGFVLYRGWVVKSRVFPIIRGIELGFNAVCLIIAGFFSLVLAYLKFI